MTPRLQAPDPGDRPVVGVGIDLADVDEIRSSVEAFGDPYLRRIFTDRELRACGGTGDAVPRLAVRFAAKEAIIKALGVEGAQPAWTDMEIRATADGSPEVRLHGRAASLAAARGARQLLVSLADGPELAGAVVVATGSGSGPSRRRSRLGRRRAARRRRAPSAEG